MNCLKHTSLIYQTLSNIRKKLSDSERSSEWGSSRFYQKVIK